MFEWRAQLAMLASLRRDGRRFCPRRADILPERFQLIFFVAAQQPYGKCKISSAARFFLSVARLMQE